MGRCYTLVRGRTRRCSNLHARRTDRGNTFRPTVWAIMTIYQTTFEIMPHHAMTRHFENMTCIPCCRMTWLQADSEFQLLVWFVNQDIHGEETSYPLLLTCQMSQPWNRREVVCEENYMEVRGLDKCLQKDGCLSSGTMGMLSQTELFYYFCTKGSNSECHIKQGFT